MELCWHNRDVPRKKYAHGQLKYTCMTLVSDTVKMCAEATTSSVVAGTTSSQEREESEERDCESVASILKAPSVSTLNRKRRVLSNRERGGGKFIEHNQGKCKHI